MREPSSGERGAFPRVHPLVAAGLGATILAAAWLAPAPAAAGPVRFFGLGPCGETDGLVFMAHDGDLPGTDTLVAHPDTGELAWLGGPVRGFGPGAGDTLYAATLLGVATLTTAGPAAFHRWETVPTGWRDGAPAAWPPLRGAPTPAGDRAPTLVGPVDPFPPPYHPLQGNALLFLQDAEQPPAPAVRLLDLHGRDAGGTEYVLARNLELRTWVLAEDDRHWALAARVHRPDYGGQVEEIVVAGSGTRVETFRVGGARALLWTRDVRLWILAADGSLYRVDPRTRAWEFRRVDPAADRSPCPPAEPESLWVWMGPGRYETAAPARRHGETVRRQTNTDMARTWATRAGDGSFRPVWGGYLHEQTLMEQIPSAPAPGAQPVAIRADLGEVTGTAARVHLPRHDGEAALRHVSQEGRFASELWWRFTTRAQSLRLAGPWGLESRDRRGASPSVDTPRIAP